MQFALNTEGKRVYAKDAEREVSYVCPLCGEPVILRRGEIKVPHFAHKSGYELCDGWHYDMSEWHLRMQSYFDEQYREVVVEKDGIKHRADILMNGVVIEFQHSPLPIGEFKKRNDFYTSCGYKVVWVVDVKDSYTKGNFLLYEKDYDTNNDLYRWKHHKQWLDGVYTNSIVVYLSWCDISDNVVDVFRCKETEEKGAVYFNYPLLYRTPYKMMNGMDAVSLFAYKPIKVKEEPRVVVKHQEAKEDVVNPNAQYTMRFMYLPGQPRYTYVCPRSGKFGLELYASYKQPYGCLTCKHCSGVSIPKNVGKDTLKHTCYGVYCHYPAVVRDFIKGAIPAKECTALVVEDLNKNEEQKPFRRPSGYEVKSRGVSGLPPKAYICPRSGKFGLESNPTSRQPYACEYCKHCGDIIHSRDRGTSIYCYFPKVVRDVTGKEPWECPEFKRDKHLYRG